MTIVLESGLLKKKKKERKREYRVRCLFYHQRNLENEYIVECFEYMFKGD